MRLAIVLALAIAWGFLFCYAVTPDEICEHIAGVCE